MRCWWWRQWSRRSTTTLAGWLGRVKNKAAFSWIFCTLFAGSQRLVLGGLVVVFSFHSVPRLDWFALFVCLLFLIQRCTRWTHLLVRFDWNTFEFWVKWLRCGENEKNREVESLPRAYRSEGIQRPPLSHPCGQWIHVECSGSEWLCGY